MDAWGNGYANRNADPEAPLPDGFYPYVPEELPPLHRGIYGYHKSKDHSQSSSATEAETATANERGANLRRRVLNKEKLKTTTQPKIRYRIRAKSSPDVLLEVAGEASPSRVPIGTDTSTGANESTVYGIGNTRVPGSTTEVHTGTTSTYGRLHPCDAALAHGQSGRDGIATGVQTGTVQHAQGEATVATTNNGSFRQDGVTRGPIGIDQRQSYDHTRARRCSTAAENANGTEAFRKKQRVHCETPVVPRAVKKARTVSAVSSDAE